MQLSQIFHTPLLVFPLKREEGDFLVVQFKKANKAAFLLNVGEPFQHTHTHTHVYFLKHKYERRGREREYETDEKEMLLNLVQFLKTSKKKNK